MSTVQRLLSPTEWKDRQIKTLTAVGEENYKVGIAKPKRDPIAAGIAAEPKYKNAMKKVLENESRRKGLEKTTMAEWYKYSSDLGANRLVEGVTKRVAKVEEFVRNWQPVLTDHLTSIDAMPDATDSEREQKMLANLRGLRELKGLA